jgi:hypothetical protein
LDRGDGQHRNSIFGAFDIADRDDLALGIHVLDSEAEAFEQAESAAIHEKRHQQMLTGQMRQDCPCLVACHHDGQSRWLPGANDIDQ